MNKDELIKLAWQFSKRPVLSMIGRHLYLWHGDFEMLSGEIPAGISEEFNLYKLIPLLPQTPNSREGAMSLIQKAIKNKLYKFIPSEKQRIILITGCDLLSRYKVPLTDFFSISSESILFIFIISPKETFFHPTSPLPDFVSLNPAHTFNYLKGIIGEVATIEVTES
jgi:hypothetical protein